jgi:dienelactone hydrolase
MNPRLASSHTRYWLTAFGILAWAANLGAAPPRVLEAGKLPDDARLAPPRTLNDKYHPWIPPSSKEAWETEKEHLRERLLVGLGLWPMPEPALLKPVIHGRIERDDYTIEKVFFASHPGHYVSGNLYRPKKIDGKIPGVLCPHGHWLNGRFYELSVEKARTEQMDKGAEKFLAGARYPLQARCVHLARMGCTVFHYDMVGVADSKQIPHAQGFTDLEAALRLHDFMGLQTFNSLRALDFLVSLPEIDTSRIGVTGASGGGTQTFMLGALDSRPSAAFPAVMISTAMQGGCICENCNYLRIGTSNVAIAAMFAPRPQALSGANDWTIDIESKGFPELQKIYGLYGQAANVAAKAYPQFDHNYNQVAREMMYNWFNQHLKLNLPKPVEERDFEPVPPAELTVYDAEHPLPKDALDAPKLRAQMAAAWTSHFEKLLPTNAAGVAEYRKIVGTAARVMLDGTLPRREDVIVATPAKEQDHGAYTLRLTTETRKGEGEQIPVVTLVPKSARGRAVVWIDGSGKQHLFDSQGAPVAAVRRLLDAGITVISADVFRTGEYLADAATADAAQPVNATFPGYTFGYNRPLMANRVRDILTVVAGARHDSGISGIDLVGTGGAGPWALLARASAGKSVERCVVDLQGFGFGRITETSDPNLLPGGLKYGGIGGLAALAAPGELDLFGTRETPADELVPLKRVYQAAGATLRITPGALTDDQAVETLLK